MLAKGFKFIDLFSGIGGFHQAMEDLGGKCVLASEIDPYAIETYKINYNMDSNKDINEISNDEIPEHEVLCAGFPCQTFSKAGKQKGFKDKTKGTLFFQIARILEHSKPSYIILENVRNLMTHDHKNTWRIISETLDELGYNVKPVIMSPHQLGVPQLRERVYILGVRKDIYSGELNFEFPESDKMTLNAYEAGIFDEKVDPKYDISKHQEKVIECWNEFYNGINLKIIGFPIWSSEFGQNYPLDEYPDWKADFCRKNRELYLSNKKFIDNWLKKWNNLNDFTPTERKFEWQAGTSIDSIWDGYVQFRPSGVRVKRPDAFPALVAMVQIPVIGKYKRRLTPREAARLQSFPESFIPNENDHQAYKQFGNAVNINCVEYLAKQLFNYTDKESKNKRIQSKKTNQIMKNSSLVIDYDQPLTSSKQILEAFNNVLDGKCTIEKYDKTKTVYCYKHDDVTEYFLSGAITYLGNPHPAFKKRFQLKPWFKDFYKDYKDKTNTKIHLIGIYHYEELIVFCEFNIEDYINRKLNSSAAHVYANDIYQAVINGSFNKKDRNSNRLNVILSKNLKSYLDGTIDKNKIFEFFEKFNLQFNFEEWIEAKEAISEMKDAEWYSWKETEWPGWFLEYKIAEFINQEKCRDVAEYIGNIKGKGKLDFDLFFKENDFYGDLKASDIIKSEAPGNDQQNVINAIMKYGRLWYIIYEHETIKDIDRDNEMAIARMDLIGKPYHEGEKISYASRMKHSVKFKKMTIYEINRINIDQALSVFNQGRQPNGEDRKPKFLINKRNMDAMDNCIVYSYEVSPKD